MDVLDARLDQERSDRCSCMPQCRACLTLETQYQIYFALQVLRWAVFNVMWGAQPVFDPITTIKGSASLASDLASATGAVSHAPLLDFNLSYRLQAQVQVQHHPCNAPCKGLTTYSTITRRASHSSGQGASTT